MSVNRIALALLLLMRSSSGAINTILLALLIARVHDLLSAGLLQTSNA